MQHTIPKFIEHEAKIVGPFTFKEFIYIGAAGLICFVLYFIIGKTNFSIYLTCCLIFGGGALSLAFLKIGGQSLPEILTHFFTFSVSTKIYLWKKKTMPPKYTMERLKKTAATEEEPAQAPKIAGRSQLKKLSTHIETTTK